MADDGWTEVKSKKRPAKPKSPQQAEPVNPSVPRATYASTQIGYVPPKVNKPAAPAPKVKAVTNTQRSNDYDKRAIDKDTGNYAGL